jgi:hypothetical protein
LSPLFFCVCGRPPVSIQASGVFFQRLFGSSGEEKAVRRRNATVPFKTTPFWALFF